MRSKTPSIIALVSSAVLSSQGYADGWNQKTLLLANEIDSSDVVEVVIDYSVNHGPFTHKEACSVSLQVSSDRGEVESARAIVNHYEYDSYSTRFEHILNSGGTELPKSTNEVDLVVSGDGELRGLLPGCFFLRGKKENDFNVRYQPAAYHDLAISIDGHWYKGFNRRNALFDLR